MDLFEHNIPLFYSGLYIESTINIETLNVLLHKYKKDIFQNSNVKSGGWYSINKNSFDIQISEIF
jgi:hypothetical protein